MIAIVTDSTVGYSSAEISSRGIVKVVPVNYQIGAKFFEERPSDKNGNFLPLIRGEKCKTAQPALSHFISAFNSLVSAGHEVICIVMSSALSGTYSSAKFAAGEVGGKIYVLDSETVGMGMHLLVDEALNMINGGFDFEHTVEHLEALKKKIRIVFTVETLDNLRAGGRLISAKGKINFNYKPIFDLYKKLTFRCNARLARDRLQILCEALPDNTRRIIVARCGETKQADELAALIGHRFAHIHVHRRELGPVLSIHTGEGAFGVAFVTQD